MLFNSTIVVLDILFHPSINITRDKRRQYIIFTLNTLPDKFLADQPYGSIPWKYQRKQTQVCSKTLHLTLLASAQALIAQCPAQYPREHLPQRALRLYAAPATSALNTKKALPREKGIKDPINFLKLHIEDVPWLTMHTDGAAVPLDAIPSNVTCTGPIFMLSAPAAEQDTEVAAWLKLAPTMLVNLGSSIRVNISVGVGFRRLLE